MLSTIHNNSQRTIDVAAIWKIIRQEVNTNRKPEINESNINKQANDETENNAVDINSTPTMVFSVIGDSVRSAGRSWPTTIFQKALIEAAKCGGDTWILFLRNNEVVSDVVQEAYKHYETVEFGTDKKSVGDPNRHIKLINIAKKETYHPASEYTQAVYQIDAVANEDQMLEFEKYILSQEVLFSSRKMNLKIPVPIAILVCEGDLTTIKHIAKALKENIPVIIMKGSGKAADLVLDYIEKNDELLKKASISLGICFDNEGYGVLEEYLGEIVKYKHRVGVFDLDQDDPLKLSNIVGETVLSCWSMEHVIATTVYGPNNSKRKEDTSGQNKSNFPKYRHSITPFSLSWNLMRKTTVSPQETILEQSFKRFKRVSRPHVLNPKFSTPTSLPLYFYIMYQRSEDTVSENVIGPILLLEALKANQCHYVRVLFAKGVKFQKADLPELYEQTVACEGCKEDPPCLHIEWILKQLEETETRNMCHSYRHLIELTEEGKKGINSWLGNKVANAAEALCRTISRYEKCRRCSEPLRKEEIEENSAISDILLWAIFANRKELAEICWLRSENHLLTGLVCAVILKKLSKKAHNVKEQILSIDFEEHSKMFEQRCIALMNSMYNENPDYAIDLMDDEAHVWGMHSSPLAFAHDNFMYDVVAHTCSQKNMNKLWYNKLPPDLKPFLKSAFTKPKQFFTAPLTKYVFNYMLFFIMLDLYSAFVLTSVSTKYYVQDTAQFLEYFVYLWGAGDLIEELISCFGCMEDQGRSHRSYYRRMKRYLYDFWNAVDLLSYALLIAALCVRHFYYSETFTLARRMFSLSLLVMYLRFLEVFLIHRKMGPTLIMIKEMLNDLLGFLFIAIFVVLGVGIYYHANLWPDHQTIWSGHWTNWRIWTIIYYPYWQLYGELNLDYLEGNGIDECTNITSVWESDTSKERCAQEDWTVQAVAAAYMLFSNLLLVNLVIAMFSYTFERVQENSEKLWKFERYTVINDYEWRIPSPINLFFLPTRFGCCPKKGKCKISCSCCSGEKKKDVEKVKFRKTFQKVIAFRNHNMI